MTSVYHLLQEWIRKGREYVTPIYLSVKALLGGVIKTAVQRYGGTPLKRPPLGPKVLSVIKGVLNSGVIQATPT